MCKDNYLVTLSVLAYAGRVRHKLKREQIQRLDRGFWLAFVIFALLGLLIVFLDHFLRAR